MKETDARNLSPKEQYNLRKQIVRLRDKGYGNRETASILDVSEPYASRIWSTYQKNGKEAIQQNKRGRRNGSGRTLTKEQEQEVRRIIIDKTPDQLRFSFALWTRQAIKELIKHKYGVEMPVTTIADYLKRWGFTAQRPTKKAWQQDPAKVAKWLEKEYPEIDRRAKEEGAQIYWGDETGLQNTAEYQRGYAPKGQTPVIRVESKKARINMLSAITNRGKVRFMIYEDTMNADKLINFMKRLVKDSERKVFFILDNLRVHHAKRVSQWLVEHKNEIEVFYLPPYSPEHNPDEYLNGDLKRSVHSGSQPRTKADLKHKTRSFMKRLQFDADHVKSYFRAKHVRYAA
jgi:transposase